MKRIKKEGSGGICIGIWWKAEQIDWWYRPVKFCFVRKTPSINWSAGLDLRLLYSPWASKCMQQVWSSSCLLQVKMKLVKLSGVMKSSLKLLWGVFSHQHRLTLSALMVTVWQLWPGASDKGSGPGFTVIMLPTLYLLIQKQAKLTPTSRLNLSIFWTRPDYTLGAKWPNQKTFPGGGNRRGQTLPLQTRIQPLPSSLEVFQFF